jgi:hypothetical protein
MILVSSRVRYVPVLALLAAVGCGGKLEGAPQSNPPLASNDSDASSSESPNASLPKQPTKSPGSQAGVAVVEEVDAGPVATNDGSAKPPPGTIWASDDGPILGLAVKGDRIFCVTQTKLLSMARDGSAVRVLAQTSLGLPFAFTGAIAVNDQAVYWGTSIGPDGQEAGSVWSIALDGGATTKIGDEGYGASGIVLDHARVYWITNDAVLSAPLGGGPATQLATLAGLSYGHDLALAGGNLYWSTNSSAIGPQTAGMFRMPATGGAPESIADGPVFSVEATADGVAWLEDPSPVIVDTPSGGTAQRIALSGWVSELASDGSRWLWRDEGTGAVYALTGPGATPQPLAGPVPASTANNGDGPHILVDQGQVIWADRSGPIAYQPDVDVLRVIDLVLR